MIGRTKSQPKSSGPGHHGHHGHLGSQQQKGEQKFVRSLNQHIQQSSLLYQQSGLSKAAGGPPSAAPSSTSSRVTRTSSLNTSKPTSREAKTSTGTKEPTSKEPALKRRTGVTGSS